MIRINPDVAVNPAHIESMRWDRTGGLVELVLRMASGQEIKIEHGPASGQDAYRIAAEIFQAFGFVSTAVTAPDPSYRSVDGHPGKIDG
jgi:hypothetical protein